MVTLDSNVLNSSILQDEENEDFLSIARSMEEIVDDPIDCYWLIKCFVHQFHAKFGDSIPHLVSVTQLLSAEGLLESILSFDFLSYTPKQNPYQKNAL